MKIIVTPIVCEVGRLRVSIHIQNVESMYSPVRCIQLDVCILFFHLSNCYCYCCFFLIEFSNAFFPMLRSLVDQIFLLLQPCHKISGNITNDFKQIHSHYFNRLAIPFYRIISIIIIISTVSQQFEAVSRHSVFIWIALIYLLFVGQSELQIYLKFIRFHELLASAVHKKGTERERDREHAM